MLIKRLGSAIVNHLKSISFGFRPRGTGYISIRLLCTYFIRAMNNNNNNNRSQSWISGALGLTVAAAVGATAYYFSGKSNKKEQQHKTVRSSPPSQQSSAHRDTEDSSSYLSNMVSRIILNSATYGTTPAAHQTSNAPDNPVITNLNSLLSDILVRFIQLREFDLHYKVFDKIFLDLHRKMKEVDNYYRKYSSTVQFAGSHFDKLRIKKPDEFDMDIVIDLPLNIKPNHFNPADSDIILEPKFPGFVQLKMGVQFQRLPMRDKEEWLNNRAAFEWKDNSNYLLRSKFIEWFESVVTKALNEFKVNGSARPIAYVSGVPYVIDVSKSGPAMTLIIRNNSKNFKMDVDLVPALKFPENRWPIANSYRPIPQKCKKGYWMVVPKPNKESPDQHDQSRSWRIALHNQERELMYNCYNLKPTIRLMKKLRDSLEMEKIASYYVKTIFFWEILEQEHVQNYWRNNVAALFKRMVGKLHEALVTGKIPYFWNKNNNLIGNVDRNTLTQYAKKLVPLMEILEDPSKYKLVAKFLLTKQEFADYNAKYLHISC